MEGGSLEIFYGAMFSGKTTHTILAATQEADTGAKTLYINHSGDIRKTKGGELGKFTSHSSSLKSLSEDVDSVCTKLLKDVCVDDYEVIVIDEGNFYTDIYETVLDWVDSRGKRVYLAALDGDSNKEFFGDVHKLNPKADKFRKLPGRCLICKEEYTKSGMPKPVPVVPAPFSKRLVDNGNQECVGGADKFISVCRRHHR